MSIKLTMLSLQDDLQPDQQIDLVDAISENNYADFHKSSEIAVQINQALEATEEAFATVSTVEKIEQVIQESPNGVSACGAQALRQAVEHLAARTGFKHRLRIISTESYDNKHTRAHLAMEGIGEFLKSIWDAIISAIKKIGEWIVSFFKWIIGANSNSEKKADRVLFKLEKLNSSSSAMNSVAKDAFEKAFKDINTAHAKNHNDKNDGRYSRHAKSHLLSKFLRVCLKDGEVIETAAELQKQYEFTTSEINQFVKNEISPSVGKPIAKIQTLLGLLDADDTTYSEQADSVHFFPNKMTVLTRGKHKEVLQRGDGPYLALEMQGFLGGYTLRETVPKDKTEHLNPEHYNLKMHAPDLGLNLFDPRLPVFQATQTIKLLEIVKKNIHLIDQTKIDGVKKILDEITHSLTSFRPNKNEEAVKERMKAVRIAVGRVVTMTQKIYVQGLMSVAQYHHALNQDLINYIASCAIVETNVRLDVLHPSR